MKLISALSLAASLFVSAAAVAQCPVDIDARWDAESPALDNTAVALISKLQADINSAKGGQELCQFERYRLDSFKAFLEQDVVSSSLISSQYMGYVLSNKLGDIQSTAKGAVHAYGYTLRHYELYRRLIALESVLDAANWREQNNFEMALRIKGVEGNELAETDVLFFMALNDVYINAYTASNYQPVETSALQPGFDAVKAKFPSRWQQFMMRP